MVAASNGQQDMWSYDAFGAQRQVYYGHVVGTPFGFAGQFSDGATGLQYLRARYYDPLTQQFLTRDPSGLSVGEPYVYANRNPVNYVDPTGLFAQVQDEEGGGDDVPPPLSAGGGPMLPGGGGGNAFAVKAAEVAAKVRSVLPSAGRWARGAAGQAALEELYGPGRTHQSFPTTKQLGARVPDLVVEENGRLIAHESCVACRPVPASSHKLRQIRKEVHLKETVAGYTPVWHFWDAPPTPRLANALQAANIQFIHYR